MESTKEQSFLRNQKGMVDTREMIEFAIGALLIVCIVGALGPILFPEKDPEITVLEKTPVQEEVKQSHSSGLFNIQNSEINIGTITVNTPIEEPPLEVRSQQEPVILEENKSSESSYETGPNMKVILFGVLISILGAGAMLYTVISAYLLEKKLKQQIEYYNTNYERG